MTEHEPMTEVEIARDESYAAKAIADEFFDKHWAAWSSYAREQWPRALAEVRRLREVVESRRKYEVQVREQEVWAKNFRKNKREDFGKWTEAVLVDIHRMVIGCDEVVGEDGLCRCMRYIGAILQQKHDLMAQMGGGGEGNV